MTLMELIVVDGEPYANEEDGTFSLTGLHNQTIQFNLRSNGDNTPKMLYEEWLARNPDEIRIEKPTFLIGRKVSEIVAGVKQRHSAKKVKKNEL